MLLFQILTALFGIIMMYVIRVHKRKGHFDSFEYGVWLAIWGGFIFLSFFPQVLNEVAGLFNIGRVFDALVIIAFMILGTLAVMNRIGLRKIEKRLEQQVREVAIHQAVDRKKSP